MSVDGVSTLTGNTNIAGSLISSGANTLYGANTFYGATSIGGAITATSTLTVSGNSVFSTASSTGIVKFSQINSDTGAISFGDENLSTTGTLNITGLTTLGNASTTLLSVSGTGYVGGANGLVLADGSITDASGSISFGDENLSTTGTLNVSGLTTLGNASTTLLSVGDDLLVAGDIAITGGSLGSDLITNGNFASGCGTGWTCNGANWTITGGKAVRTASNDGLSLTQEFGSVVGTVYKVVFTVSDRTNGSFIVYIGAQRAVPVVSSGSTNTTYTIYIAAATSGDDLTFTPNDSFDGKIDDVTTQAITGNTFTVDGASNLRGVATFQSAPLFKAPTLSLGSMDFRANYTLGSIVLGGGGVNEATNGGNTGVGYLSLNSITTGMKNAAFGYEALKLTTGDYNSAAGYQSLATNTSGSYNTAVGYHAAWLSQTVNENTGVGYSALLHATAGYNSGFGSKSLSEITTGAYNTGLGWQSGSYNGSGSSLNLTSTYSTYLGADTRASADGNTNETVIGYLAIGGGSNSTTLGNASVTKAVIRGLVENTVQSVTCTAGGGISALTITPTSSYVEITNADADGCNITMGETGMTIGSVVTICVISNAGTTVNFADTAGVTELNGVLNADIDDCITLRYGNTTTWREQSRSAN